MPSGQWAYSDRRERLPRDWPVRRIRRLKADGYRCRWTLADGSRCREVATDVDHIVPNDDHSHENLQSLCHDHHLEKSSREGVEAREARRAAARLPAERHPGFLRRADDPPRSPASPLR